jgi:hypothetical protein
MFKMDDNDLVFVDGNLFGGKVIYDRYKGLGWEDGRTHSFKTEPPIDKNSEVLIVNLTYYKIRHCNFNDDKFIGLPWLPIDR